MVHQRVRVGEHEIKQKGEGGKGEWWGSMRENIKGRGGGAAFSTCNAAGEIFQIAAIMNGLVLVGVAIGFVLLRVEAFVEESE